MGTPLQQLFEGARVELTRDYGDFPFPRPIPSGSVGTITEIFPHEGMVNVRLDVPYDFLDEWCNRLQIAPEEYGFGINSDGTYPLRLIP